MTVLSSEDEEYTAKMFKRPDKKQEIGFALSSFYILLMEEESQLWRSSEWYAEKKIAINNVW